MPLELIAEQPGQAVFRQYEEVELQPDQIRIRSLFSSVKHGTELRGFRADTPDASDRWDGALRLHRRGEVAKEPFPMALGNMCLGQITAVGPAVVDFSVGQEVFGHMPLRQSHTVAASRVQLAPEGVSPQALMYWDPADFAVGAIQDGPVRLGDRVAVFGLGAIGQMVVQAARLAGARWVVAIDPIALRREAALAHGADLALDPLAIDVGVDIKERTGNLGTDISFETSGAYAALEDALRTTCYQGTVVSTAYYPSSGGVRLVGEWHRNRIQVRSSRACSQPLPAFGWDFARIQAESLALLVEGRLQVEGLITPIVPFSEAAAAYQAINAQPETSIKLGIDHTLEGAL